MKICSHCKDTKNLGSFHKNSRNEDGYHGACKDCRKIESIKRNTIHKDRIKIKRHLSYEDSKEEILLRNKVWVKDNPNWQINYRRNYMRKRLKEDPHFRVKQNLRRRLHHALAGTVKLASTTDLLGCTIPELWIHIEKQFIDGMTRGNYGKWHIDHIKACSKFDLTDPNQQRECFHYSNLQPLWAMDNFVKGAK